MTKLFAPVAAALIMIGRPAAAAAVQAPATHCDKAAKLAEAHAIIAIMFPPATRDAMVRKLMDQLDAQFRQGTGIGNFGDPGFNKIVNDALDAMHPRQIEMLQQHMPGLLDASAMAYTRMFTLDELKDVHAFATTPSGARYLQRVVDVMGDPGVAKANADLIADAQKLAISMSGDLKDKLVAYLKAHPEVLEKLKAEETK